MKKKISFVVVDLVEDKIKTRGLFVIVSLLFYVYMTWMFFIGEHKRDTSPYSMEISLDFPRIITIGSNLTEYVPPQVKVLNSRGERLRDVLVKIDVIKVTTDTAKTNGNLKSPICDFDYREKIKGSMEFIRFSEICRVVLSGDSETTDDKGNANFKNFKIERGPEALYTLQYHIKINDYTYIYSETFSTYASSKINLLESLSSTSLLSREDLNKPLSNQPQIRITDVTGALLKDKRVIAFTWIQSTFQAFGGEKNSPSYSKIFVLKNSISEPSDSNGIAKFKDLTIIGTSDAIAFIHFYCEGKTTFWTNRFSNPSYAKILPPRALYPLIALANTPKITLVNDQIRYLNEGGLIDPPFKLALTSSSDSSPLEGIMCFAFMYKAYGKIIPKYYQSSIPNHPVKYLERPISGKYVEDADNPSIEEPIISEYYFSNKEGIVIFEDMRISQSGPIGNFSVQFKCSNGLRTAINDIITLTSIVRFKFAQPPPNELIVDSTKKQDFDFTLIIEVTDKNDAGVPGKYPTNLFIDPLNAADKSNIEIKIVNEIELFTSSQKDGVMTIPLKVSKLTKDVDATITLVIDNVNVTTPKISFFLGDYQNSTKISNMVITSYPKDKFESGIMINEKFELRAKAFNIFGKEVDISKYYFFAGIFYNSILGQGDLPDEFVVLQQGKFYLTGNEIVIPNCYFSRAATGHYDLRIYASTQDMYNGVFFGTSFVKVLINFNIGSVELKNITFSDDTFDFGRKSTLKPVFKDLTREGEYVNITIGKTYIMEVLIADSDFQILRNQDISLASIIYHEYPPSMYAIKGPSRYFKMKQLSTKTSSNGTILFETKIINGGIGGYVVSIDFGNCMSLPIPFKTENVLSGISIITEPGFKDSNNHNNPIYVGRPFDIKAKVKVNVMKGPKDGYVVIAHPCIVTQSIVAFDLFPESQFDLNENKENYMAWVTGLEKGRFAITNSDGVAEFNDLTVWDISGSNATFRIIFAAGDRQPGLYVTSNMTNSNYTFIPSMKFSIISEPNKFISAFTSVDPYPIIKASFMIERPFLLINMIFSEIFNNVTADNQIGDVTNKYISNTLCYHNLTDLSVKADGCFAKLISRSGRLPIEYEVHFNQMIWTAYGVDSYVKMSFSNILQHRPDIEAMTQKVSIETSAKTISFYVDPPSEVSVNTIFQVSLRVGINGGTPLPGALVSCNVTKAFSFTSIAAEIFTSLANSNYNIQRSAFLAPGSKLDEKRTRAIADSNGIAKLYIRVKESPVDSQVRIVCESGKAITPPSPRITVNHVIRKITVDQTISEKISKVFKRDENKYLSTDINLKSTVNLTLWEWENADIDLIRSEDIKIDLLKYSELESYRKANISIIDSISSLKNVSDVSSAFDQLINIATTLMRGIQTVSAIKQQQKRISNIIFNRPIIKDHNVSIKNITIIVEEPGEYALIYSANGVYTSIFDNETKIVVVDDIPTFKVFFDYIETSLTTIFYFMVLLFASKFVKGYWLFIAFLINALYVYMISYKSGVTLLYMIVVYFFSGIICLQLIWSFIIYFIDTFIKHKEPSYFYNRKRRFFIEYTFQRLNGHPSNYWVNEKQKRGIKIDNFYNDFDQKFNTHLLEIKKNRVIDEESKCENYIINTTHDKKENTFEEYRASIKHELLSDYTPPLIENNKGNRKYTIAELAEITNDMKPYDSLGTCAKMLRCLTPFDLMYKRVWVTDCFIYPQILITSIIITFFSMTYLGYRTFMVIFDLTDLINDGYDKVYTSAFTFLRTGLEKYFGMFKYEPTKEDFGHYFTTLEEVGVVLNQLIFAVKLGAFIGLFISILFVFCNFFWILYDYKKRVLDARKGIIDFNINKVPIRYYTLLPAAIISNSIFMYFLIILVLTIVFSIACWPVTWGILWFIKWTLLDALIGILLNLVIRLTMYFLCFNYHTIKRRWLLGVFDFFLLNIAILAGMITAIKRFAILFGVLFVSLVRIDVNSMPVWISKIIYLDSFNKGYFASILVQHTHNNPILVTFYNLIFLITRPVNSAPSFSEEERTSINRKKKIRNRLHLWLFLTKNPNLCEYRVKSQDDGSDLEEKKSSKTMEERKIGYDISDIDPILIK